MKKIKRWCLLLSITPQELIKIISALKKEFGNDVDVIIENGIIKSMVVEKSKFFLCIITF